MNTRIRILLAIGFVGMLSLLSNGCSKKLTETPYTVFNTTYYLSPTGLQSGLTTLYAGMRFNYGPEPALAITVMGTDEYTGGDQVTASTGGQYIRSFALYGGGTPIQSSDGSLLNQWNNDFNLVNLANLLITDAPQVAIDTATKVNVIATARFMRGLYYLLLVEQFGAVPTDLGSGDLQFNNKPFQGFNRLPVNDILAKDWTAIISDFTYASQNLPDQRPVNAFRLSKGAAFLMLSRAYMFRGYSSQKQADDFKNAGIAAMEVINNQTKYGVSLLAISARSMPRGMTITARSCIR